MVAKCANPSCAARFHRFNEGRLFRLATPQRHEEYFWLCGPCSATHILVADEDGKPHLRPKPEAESHAKKEGSASAGGATGKTSGYVAIHVRRRGRHRT
jgi:hypothetical protein